MKSARRKGVIDMDFSTSKPTISKNHSNSTTTQNSLQSSTAKSNSLATQKGHRLELDYERAMSMTGVKDVPVFTDKNITVRLENETLLVTGQNLAVKTLDVENGKLQVTGRVFSLKYTAQSTPTSFIKRIFK